MKKGKAAFAFRTVAPNTSSVEAAVGLAQPLRACRSDSPGRTIVRSLANV